MLSKADNELLIHTGPGTPMGELLRRYWMPIAGQSDLERTPIVPIRLLSEDLVLLQNEGLSRLDESTRRRLLERYESETGNPFADEVAAFLRGEYVFDTQCLTS